MRGFTFIGLVAAWVGGAMPASAQAAEAEAEGRTAISIDHVYLGDREIFRATVRQRQVIEPGGGKPMVLELPGKADFSSVVVRSNDGEGASRLLDHHVRMAEKDPDSILARFLGKDVIVNRKLPPGTEKARPAVETIQATLVSFDAKVLTLKTNNPQLPLLMIPRTEEITEIKLRGEAEGIVARPVVQVSVDGAQAHGLEYSYRVSDLQWRGQYRVLVGDDGKGIAASGTIEVFNETGAEYATVDLTLGTRVGQKSVFESKLARRLTIAEGWTRVGLFDISTAKFEKVYLIDWNTREGGQEAIVIRNAKEAGLGMPLPQGKLEVMRQRDLMLLNEPTVLAGAAVGKDLILPISEAGGIDRVRRVRASALPEPDGAWRRRDEVELTLVSTRGQATKVRVIDNIMRRTFRIVGGSTEHEMLDETRIGFVVNVPAGGEKVIRYNVDYPDR